MAYLKVYEWEHNTWPELQGIEIGREYGKYLVGRLARYFKVREPSIIQSHRRKGSATYWSGREAIALHKVTYLDLVLHEFAHHLNWVKYKQHGHRKSFKKCLKMVYRRAKHWTKEAYTENFGEAGGFMVEIVKEIVKRGGFKHYGNLQQAGQNKDAPVDGKA